MRLRGHRPEGRKDRYGKLSEHLYRMCDDPDSTDVSPPRYPDPGAMDFLHKRRYRDEIPGHVTDADTCVTAARRHDLVTECDG